MHAVAQHIRLQYNKTFGTSKGNSSNCSVSVSLVSMADHEDIPKAVEVHAVN